MKGFTKRFMALLLCFCLMLSVAPLSSFATDDDAGDASNETGVTVTTVESDDAGSDEDESADESATDETAADESSSDEAPASDETGGGC